MQVTVSKTHMEKTTPVRKVRAIFEIASMDDLIPQLIKEVDRLFNLFNKQDWQYCIAGADIEVDNTREHLYMPSYEKAEDLLYDCRGWSELEIKTLFFHDNPESQDDGDSWEEDPWEDDFWEICWTSCEECWLQECSGILSDCEVQDLDDLES